MLGGYELSVITARLAILDSLAFDMATSSWKHFKTVFQAGREAWGMWDCGA